MTKIDIGKYSESGRAVMLDVEELGQTVGMVFSGGTFNTYIGELKSAGLIETIDGELRATKELFP